MARNNDGWVSLGPLKGQNNSDNPLSLGEGWATDTLNLVLDPLSSMAVKRRGSTDFTCPTGSYKIAQHVSLTSTEANAELWAFASSGFYRKIGLGAFESVAWPYSLFVLRTLSFNGKLFLANVSSGINRLHVWDGTQVRKVGLRGPTVPPTVGQGAVVAGLTAKARYYKIDWIYINGGATQSRSELSPVATITNVAGYGIRVTHSGTIEHATHWRAWGSADGAIFFKLSGNIPAAQVYFDDVIDPLTYSGEVAPEIGSFLPPPACSRIITDGHRILMAASPADAFPAFISGETSPRTNRMWYTPVLGSLDQADDERIPQTSDQKNFLDIGEPPTGDLVELAGPMAGQIFAFAKHRTWRMVPTGDLVTPYLTYPVTTTFGAGESKTYVQEATALGETESGQPAIYFFDDRAGLYRVTSGDDVQYVSYDIQSEILSLRPRLYAGMTLFSWPEVKQTWWILPLINPFEARIYVFHWDAGETKAQSVQGGWTKWIHLGLDLLSGAILHNRIPGEDTTYGRSRVPYVIAHNGFTVYVFDRGVAKDGNNAYSASVTCAPILPAAAHEQIRVGPPTIITSPHLMTRLVVSSIRDFGTEERTADIWLNPDGNETAVVRTAEGLYQGDCTAIQIKIADIVPNEALWQIHLATMPVSKQQPR